jgi:hypothetical protein
MLHDLLRRFILSIRNLQPLVVMIEPFVRATTFAKEGEVVPAKRRLRDNRMLRHCAQQKTCRATSRVSSNPKLVRAYIHLFQAVQRSSQSETRKQAVSGYRYSSRSIPTTKGLPKPIITKEKMTIPKATLPCFGTWFSTVETDQSNVYIARRGDCCVQLQVYDCYSSSSSSIIGRDRIFLDIIIVGSREEVDELVTATNQSKTSTQLANPMTLGKPLTSQAVTAEGPMPNSGVPRSKSSDIIAPARRNGVNLESLAPKGFPMQNGAVSWEDYWVQQRKKQDREELCRVLTSPSRLMWPNEFGLQATLLSNAAAWYFTHCDAAPGDFEGIDVGMVLEVKAVLFLRMQQHVKLSCLVNSAGVDMGEIMSDDFSKRLDDALLARYPYLQNAYDLVVQGNLDSFKPCRVRDH